MNSFTSSNPYWNISLLSLAWCWTLTASTLLTTIGPLSATSLGVKDSLAAFTIGLFLLGTALMSIPSPYLFRNYGRYGGFSCGCICQVIGSVFGMVAMLYKSPATLFFGCFFLGLGQGMGQFYRFSAVEVTPSELKARAVSYVLSGGVVSAFLGPTIALETAFFEPRIYVASFFAMGIIAILNELTITLVKFPPMISPRAVSLIAKARPLREVCAQPLFLISCAVATLAHTIMVMLMSNVTLEMHDRQLPFISYSLVMELHFFSMFGPGFVTGSLINLWGPFSVAAAGVCVSAAGIVVLAIGFEEWNFIVGMMLIGLGWNFSFSSATVMVTGSYQTNEAAKVQAVNDFILFTTAGVGSLISGVIFERFVMNLGLFYMAWALFLREEADTDADTAERRRESISGNLASSNAPFSDPLAAAQHRSRASFRASSSAATSDSRFSSSAAGASGASVSRYSWGLRKSTGDDSASRVSGASAVTVLSHHTTGSEASGQGQGGLGDQSISTQGNAEL